MCSASQWATPSCWGRRPLRRPLRGRPDRRSPATPRPAQVSSGMSLGMSPKATTWAGSQPRSRARSARVLALSDPAPPRATGGSATMADGHRIPGGRDHLGCDRTGVGHRAGATSQEFHRALGRQHVRPVVRRPAPSWQPANLPRGSTATRSRAPGRPRPRSARPAHFGPDDVAYRRQLGGARQ